MGEKCATLLSVEHVIHTEPYNGDLALDSRRARFDLIQKNLLARQQQLLFNLKSVTSVDRLGSLTKMATQPSRVVKTC